MPWPLAKATLQALGLHVSTGWATSIGRQNIVDTSSDQYRRLTEKLYSIYQQHTLVGEKMVRWYSLTGIPAPVATLFSAAVRAAPTTVHVDSDSQFHDTYPFPVRDIKSLKRLEELGPVLSAVLERAGKTVFHYSSVRSYRDRVELSPESFSQEDRERLREYEEIYAVLPIRRHCNDAIVFDHNNQLMELRVDAPYGMSVEEVNLAAQEVTEQFNKLAESSFGYTPFGENAISFYSAIDPMYRNNSEGRVYELGFMAMATGSTSNNRGKLVRGKNHDLRKDAFHIGGSSAVQEITPYRIGVEWHGDGLDGAPQLVIPGTMRMLHKFPINVPEAFIRNCASEKDFAFVTNRLRSYIFKNS
jgi:hypothetical protein